jgi:hypothetical protein
MYIGSRSSQYKSAKLFAEQGTPYVVHYNKQNLDDRAKITTGAKESSGRISENRRTIIRLPSNRQYTFTINLFRDGGVLCKCLETNMRLLAKSFAPEGTKRIIDFLPNGTITCVSEHVEVHEQLHQMSMEEWVHDLFDNSDIVTTPTAYGEEIRFLPRQLPSTVPMFRDVGPS